MSDTRFARDATGRDVAFRTFSDQDGPTVLVLPGGTMPIEVLHEDPMMALFLRTLGRYGTVHAMDRPGIGASDDLDPDVDYHEQTIVACLAVLDEVGAATAWTVTGAFGSGALARALSRAPERFRGGALLNPVRLGDNPDRLARVLDRDHETFEEVMERVAPSRWSDPSYRSWYERAGRLGASAGAAKTFYAAIRAANVAFDADPAPVVGDHPVLVIHRRDNARTTLEESRWWADHFPDGTLQVVDGADTIIEALDSGRIADTIGGFITGRRLQSADDRPLRAVLFVDLVASTERVAAAGDGPWRAVLDRFESAADSVVTHQGGTLIKHTGDGALATFATGSRAVDAARELRRAVADLDLECRIGIHVGEIEQRGDDIGGVAVHLAARVMDRAAAGQILVSSSVAQTTTGSPVEFRSLGAFELKGLERPWELLEVAEAHGD